MKYQHLLNKYKIKISLGRKKIKLNNDGHYQFPIKIERGKTSFIGKAIASDLDLKQVLEQAFERYLLDFFWLEEQFPKTKTICLKELRQWISCQDTKELEDTFKEYCDLVKKFSIIFTKESIAEFKIIARGIEMKYQQLVDKHNIKCSYKVVYKDYGKDDWRTKANQYIVVLKFGRHKLTTNWFQGKGIDHEPVAADVIEGLITDLFAGAAESFEEFCSEFGYDSDSRKAEKTYKDCKVIAFKLKRFLGESLKEFIQVYNEGEE